MIDAVMTLFAFLPVLIRAVGKVTDLPLIGSFPHALLYAAIGWSLFGTVLLAVAGVKLPGLNFRNQRVEAAYRKELVYGEDSAGAPSADPARAVRSGANATTSGCSFTTPISTSSAASTSRPTTCSPTLILIPTIVAGKITFGILQQILTAFGQVSNSFQYLISSWTTIVELQSIYKRLRAFEAAFEGKELDDIETRQFKGEEVPL